jgi:hypothetical protein
VLRAFLVSIDREVQVASAGGVAIWWPLSQAGASQRVLRLCTQDAVLLNSRDKASGQEKPTLRGLLATVRGPLPCLLNPVAYCA